MVDKKVMEILACPMCKGPVAEKEGWILCYTCEKRFPIRDDIPIMLEEEAEDIPKK